MRPGSETLSAASPAVVITVAVVRRVVGARDAGGERAERGRRAERERERRRHGAADRALREGRAARVADPVPVAVGLAGVGDERAVVGLVEVAVGVAVAEGRAPGVDEDGDG